MGIQHEVVGDAMQMVVCQLGGDQLVYGEAGKFLWKTPNVSVETRLSKPAGQGQSESVAGGGTAAS